MAASNPVRFSLTAGATFSSGDLYKGVTVDSSGHAVLLHNGGSTGGSGVVGSLYSFTATTSGAGVEAVQIGSANSPTFKAFAAGSTLAAGDIAAFSTADSHLAAPTTNRDNLFVIVSGSSGSTGRIVEIARA